MPVRGILTPGPTQETIAQHMQLTKDCLRRVTSMNQVIEVAGGEFASNGGGIALYFNVSVPYLGSECRYRVWPAEQQGSHRTSGHKIDEFIPTVCVRLVALWFACLQSWSNLVTVKVFNCCLIKVYRKFRKHS